MILQDRSATIRSAASLCGRAFADDPLYRTAEPNARARQSFARVIGGFYCAYCLRYGRVMIRGSGPDGIMMLLPPEEYDLSFPKMVRCGALTLPFKAPLRTLARLMAVDSVANAAHERDAARPHWYLLMIAVEPAQQGRGVGSSMLEPFLAERDVATEAVYLDTHSEANVAMYERFGFELKSSSAIPGLPGVLHHSMLRMPRIR